MIASIVAVTVIRKGNVVTYCVKLYIVNPSFCLIGSRCRETVNVTKAVKYQENDIDMTENTVYDQVKTYHKNITLNKNVAYCCTSDYVYI